MVASETSFGQLADVGWSKKIGICRAWAGEIDFSN
jgi:hypothetical protein